MWRQLLIRGCLVLALLGFHTGISSAGDSPKATPQKSPLPSRNIGDLNWMTFREIVPQKINTVLLPVGTLEAHGVLNNGADNTVPEKLSQLIAERIDALVAPVIPYGVTGSLARFPGGIRIEPEVFEAYCEQVVRGLANCGFKNIIIVNGHGPNRQPLDQVAQRVSSQTPARILVFDWWTYTADITEEVYGQSGGHAGINETAAILAINPKLVESNRYSKELATPIDRAFTAYPYPSTILLYKAGEGYPDFDRRKAALFFEKVVDKCSRLIKDVIAKWDAAGL